jgi:chemotaxis protein histidine kinase CheA/ActR/RegA family two-component response regulator
MTIEPEFQEQIEQYFFTEASDMLQTIEQTLLSLLEEKTTEKVHILMRSAHTLKGSAANFEMETIKTIAHHLEDVFQALYPAELEIDPDLGLLLLEGYECLRTPLMATLSSLPYDEAVILDKTASVFAQLQHKLGDFFGREAPLPTSEELGFDVVGLIFSDSVPQDLQQLEAAIASQDAGQIESALRYQAQFFVDLSASYSLPGLEAIAQATFAALDRHPDRAMAIAQTALENFKQARDAIMAGDRDRGGEISPQLRHWAELSSPPSESTISEVIEENLAPSLPDLPPHEEVPSLGWNFFDDDIPEESTTLPEVVEEATPQEETPQEETPALSWSLLEDETEQPTTVPQELTPQEEAPALSWSLLEDETEQPTTVPQELTPQEEAPALSWSLLEDETEQPTTVPQELTPQEEAPALSWSLLEDKTEELAAISEVLEDSTLLSQEEISSSNDLLDDDSGFRPPSPLPPFIPPTLGELGGKSQSPPSLGDLGGCSAVYSTENRYETENSIAIPESVEEDLASSIPDAEESFDRATGSEPSSIDRILQSLFAQGIETSIPASQTKTANASTTPPPSPKIQPATTSLSIRVVVEQIDRLTEAIGELLINETQQNLQSEQIQNTAKDAFEQFLRCQEQLNLVRDWSDKNLLLGDRKRRQINKEKIKTKTLPSVQSDFDALEMDIYSDLHLLLQNLTENMMRLGDKIETIEGMSQQFRLNLGKRKQLLSGAQEDLMQARMVPIGTVLNRFPRMVQQMVATYYKKAELKLSGTQVPIDKVIAEKLYDPLLHIIRNAYDHGLENGGDRLQIGKPEIGQISIDAYHQGNRTTIEIRDDGQGLDWERIRQKAIDKQLLTPAQAASATEDQLAEVLFEPGFSTAEKVGELSGRGIGLDVVRSQLNALQGTIVVRSRSGQGTTFLLQLPLSLTTARLLVCQSGGTTYSILSDAIAQILLPPPDRIQRQVSITGGLQTFLRWEEDSKQQLIPLYSLTNLLGYRYPIFAQNKDSSLSPFALKARNQVNPVLMLQFNGQKICLQVERILVEQELVIKTLGKLLTVPSYIQGYSVLGDGSLTLVIDPIELLDRVKETAPTNIIPQPDLADVAIPAEIANPQPEQAINQNLKVLVVDDSVVQRQSLVRTLDKVGYHVIQAENGQDAIAQLNRHPEIDLVICDLEMPQMNGFEFLSYCRQDARFSQIPVMMLTTRSGQKHRQLAFALGAKEYCTKPYSDPEILENVVKLTKASS